MQIGMIRGMTVDRATPEILIANQWDDYALLDSGNLLKLERFGPYCFVRPEPQALWEPRLDVSHWQVDGTFIASQAGRRDNSDEAIDYRQRDKRDPFPKGKFESIHW